MAGRLGLLAFQGGLPAAVVAANPDCFVAVFDGIAAEIAPTMGAPHRFETLGALIDDMRAAGVDRLVMAGALARPPLDPTRLDSLTMSFAPRLMSVLGQGDDALLRCVIGFFEEQGFTVIGAHQAVPDLTLEPGFQHGPDPDPKAEDAAARAEAILTALGALDVGQAAVVAGGICLGIETLQGTDAMLRQVAELPERLRPKAPAVLVKRPKSGQDLRVDMPAIGPDTVQAAADAGLAGIAIAAGRVLVIDRPGVMAALDRTGLFLTARD